MSYAPMFNRVQGFFSNKIWTKILLIFALASMLIMSRLCIVSVNFPEFPSQHISLSFLSPGGTTSRPRDVVPCPPNPSADPHQRGLETDQWEGKPGANRLQHSSQPEPLGSGDTVTWNVHEEKDLQIHTQGMRECERMDWLLTKKTKRTLRKLQ